MERRKWFISTIIITIAVLGSVALATFIIDPYFHYHKPLKQISYRIHDERYVCDGILRNFEYDSIIIGTSMTQNFKTTEFEKLFSGKAVKTPLAGAGFKEISETLSRAFTYNKGIKQVLRGIDYGYLLQPADYTNYDDYPEYMYDNNPWNDIRYLLNKNILFHETLYSLIATLKNEKTTTFDEFSSWERPSGTEAVMNMYNRSSDIIKNEELSEEERKQVESTVKENLIQIAEENPDTTFYLFYTPYSVIYWDKMNREGNLLKQLEADEIATRLLTECDNIKLFSFGLNKELVTNLQHYTDIGHYNADVNTLILEWISSGEGCITKENREKYIQEMYTFYERFDYDKYINESIG